MKDLRIRVYDVRFGDAILLSIPQDGSVAHVLIDLGNVKAGKGGDDDVFLPIVEDILEELGGRGLDLYVSTHEHLDHVQGLLHASRTLEKEDSPRNLARLLKPKHVWLTGSAEPGYYDAHPKARKKKKLQEALAKGLAGTRRLLPARFDAMAANNNPGTTDHCTAFVRGMTRAESVTYLHRGMDVAGRHGLKGVKFKILAPEEDTSVYYGRSKKHAAAPWEDDELASRVEELAKSDELPPAPAGVDALAFRRLWEQFRHGTLAEALLQVDKAENNTSIVFILEWRGWRLLFTGDAEERSWDTMHEKGVLEPVHFLKVSHHGSHNGTPADEVLEAVLPLAAGPADRVAVVSTCPDTYGGIPHGPTDRRLKSRCEKYLKTTARGLRTTSSGARHFDVTFSPKGP